MNGKLQRLQEQEADQERLEDSPAPSVVPVVEEKKKKKKKRRQSVDSNE